MNLLSVLVRIHSFRFLTSAQKEIHISVSHITLRCFLPHCFFAIFEHGISAMRQTFVLK